MQQESASPQYTAAESLALTPFRLAEKRYKLYRLDRRAARRQPAPETDFSDVVDVRRPDANTQRNRSLLRSVQTGGDSQARCFAFTAVPGLLLFPECIPAEEQQALCRDAVLKYGDSRQHPNHLSTHATAPRSTTRYEAPMRWATLGFSYDWTTKTYSRGRYSPFPSALRRRIEEILRLCGSAAGLDAAGVSAYEPQTAIVNYFPVGSMMMAHQDVSEESMRWPLISISLGCSCVFLMGTDSREEAPYAFLLRSGDVAVFSGPARVAFHSVPRIMDDCPPHLRPRPEGRDGAQPATRLARDGEDVDDGDAYWRAQMLHMRINVNVRQVYADSCEFLFEA
ncbi:alkylated DNA repair protein [Trypanosoma conorhini]|uniref:Alkylated DNA repair protein n=1 Tax=Trypanosoma conorhini TaxID=83891 RepID=A0A3R7KLM4_9TRYP|nr:alkylated DNA repair protein [Trypanosoma conorhini]RNF04003.1 alkylated DNA repair protein [Trypanosoma conorhini]